MISEGMTVRDFITIAAIILGPLMAVGITLWWQQRKEKRDAKRQLFFTLMSHRGAIHLSPEAVMAVNIINVVFAAHPRVVELWHQLYVALHTKPLPTQEVSHLHVELLSAMAGILGFRQLQQVDIGRYYTPQIREDQLQAQTDLHTQWMRVLQNTERFVVEKKSE